MPNITIKTPFRYAFRGCEVVDFHKGEQDVPEEVAALAIAEGWAENSEAPHQDPAPATGRTRKTKD